MSLSVISCRWQDHQAEIEHIRKVVFVEEQNVPLELEWDGEDENAWHILAFQDDRPVGTARLLASGQIGRMSVLASFRRNGIGTLILQKVESTAQEHGISPLFLHAQTYIQHFYAQHGYTPHGSEFMDAGIPHVEMTKNT
ncbi:MAG: GNAT family N-acetyltransferase [Pseudomonadales bacterium]|nr:GNAT family N-acetyltransferase [Pseudomonadales bacterium]